LIDKLLSQPEHVVFFDQIIDIEAASQLEAFDNLIKVLAYPKNSGVPVLFGSPTMPVYRSAASIDSQIYRSIEAWFSYISQEIQKEKRQKFFNFDLYLPIAINENHWVLVKIEFRQANLGFGNQLIQLCIDKESKLSPQDYRSQANGPIDGDRLDADSRRLQRQADELIKGLYAEKELKYVDSLGHAMPRNLKKVLFSALSLSEYTQLQCPHQGDGFSCGDRTALHAVQLAANQELETSSQLREKTINLLSHDSFIDANRRVSSYAYRLRNKNKESGYSQEDSEPLEEEFFLANVLYVLLAFISAMIIGLVINHFVAASSLALVGGFWGMFGIIMGGLLVLKFAAGVLGPQISEIKENRNKDTHLSDKPLQASALQYETERKSLKTTHLPSGPRPESTGAHSTVPVDQSNTAL
jgi:hypothetical protein